MTWARECMEVVLGRHKGGCVGGGVRRNRVVAGRGFMVLASGHKANADLFPLPTRLRSHICCC